MSKSRVAERRAAYALKTAVEPAFGTSFDLLATAPQGVAKLRELILSSAVRGRLLAQEPTDEPACALLTSIASLREKALSGRRARGAAERSHADNFNSADLLPAGWITAAGGELYSVVRGVSYQKQDAIESPRASYIPLLRANNIQQRMNFNSLVYVPEHLVSIDQRLVEGDFVVCLASGSKSLVGKAARFSGTECYTFGAFCGSLRAFDTTIVPYLSVFFASPLYRDAVSLASSGIGINNLKSTTLVALDVPLPPLAEQARIVARVEELMQLCDTLEAHGRLQDEQHARLVATLFDVLAASTSAEELAENWQRIATHFDLLLDRPEAVDALEQAILQLAVRGLLVPQDESDEPASKLLDRIRAEKGQLVAEGKVGRDMPLPQVADDEAPFVVPAAWQWVRFGALVRKSEAGWSPSCEGGSRRGDAWGVLKVSAVSWGEFRSSENKQLPASLKPRPEYEVQSGDFLISRANTEELVARSVVAKNPEPRLMLSDKIIRLDISSLVDRDFLNMVNNAKTSRTYYAENASGTSSSMKNVGRQVILNLPIPLPALAEQHRIVARVEQLRRLCADLRERLQQARVTQSRLADALVSAADQSSAC
ncbi:restriction endonuclease subunit S [Comamonas sp. SCN 65-56]|uniref:restriction endonuclease subunit S n=1 Tax=Comamonas sp. SCN 65-56 TaxID=1660095 RepID=UPI000ABBD600|nr:restriction endonuclease subunit S [Comamonas sp. SCN 65-56]